MAVSKRLRYEVLRRDNHACRYCGATAPATTLTVDHVLPKALGGTDEATNLVAACYPCNAGKSSASPDSSLIADVNADALRWNRARVVAAEMIRAETDRREDIASEVIEFWEDHIRCADPGEGAEESILMWYDRGLDPMDMMWLIVNVVAPKWDSGSVATANLWSYFAGCCWTRLRQIEASAQALIDNGEV